MTQVSETTSGPLVSVTNLGMTFEPVPRWMGLVVKSPIRDSLVALDDVSFDVGRGEILAVVGPNGAGKTTLFRILTGLVRPSTGRAVVAGMDPGDEWLKVRRRLGYLPADDRTLHLRLTSRENLLVHGRFQGMRDDEIARRSKEVLELVDIASKADVAAFTLSTGMRYRLMLARALLHAPAVLVLDEPTGPLDPVTAHRFIHDLEEIARAHGTSVLLSSHRMDDVEALHDRVMVLNRGRVLFDGDVDQLRALDGARRVMIRWRSPEAASSARQRLSDVAEEQHVEVNEHDPLATSLRTTLDVGELLGGLEALRAEIVSIEILRPALRDVIHRLTSDDDIVAGTRTHGGPAA